MSPSITEFWAFKGFANYWQWKKIIGWEYKFLTMLTTCFYFFGLVFIHVNRVYMVSQLRVGTVLTCPRFSKIALISDVPLCGLLKYPQIYQKICPIASLSMWQTRFLIKSLLWWQWLVLIHSWSVVTARPESSDAELLPRVDTVVLLFSEVQRKENTPSIASGINFFKNCESEQFCLIKWNLLQCWQWQYECLF